MIHTADTKPKFKRLARCLAALVGNSILSGELVAKGVLEGLWHLTIREAFVGDIGRLTNDDIAIGLGWYGDADALVDALVRCGWLDEHPMYRLVVHDWHQWSPNFVRGNIVKYAKNFASLSSEMLPQGDSPEDAPLSSSLGDAPQGNSPGGLASKPQHQPVTQTNTGRRRQDDVDHRWTGKELSQSQVAAIDETRRKLTRDLPPQNTEDSDLATKVSILAIAHFGENWLWDAVDGVKRSKKPIRNPWAYLKTCLENATAELDEHFDQHLATTYIPVELLQANGNH